MKSLFPILVFIILLTLIVTSCKNDENKQQTTNLSEEDRLNENEDSIRSQAFLSTLSKPAKSDVSLIALKYRINDSIAEKIIWEYSKVHDETVILFSALYDMQSDSITSESKLYDKLLNPELKESNIMTINRLSTKYNVSTDTLASVIYDYIIWMAVKQESEDDFDNY